MGAACCRSSTLIFIQPPSTTTFATPSSPLVATSISSTIALAGYVVCFNDLRSHSYLSFLLELVSITLVSHSTKHHSFYLLRRRTIFETGASDHQRPTKHPHCWVLPDSKPTTSVKPRQPHITPHINRYIPLPPPFTKSQSRTMESHRGFVYARDLTELDAVMRLIPRAGECVKCDATSTLECPNCSEGTECQFTIPSDCTECSQARCVAPS